MHLTRRLALRRGGCPTKICVRRYAAVSRISVSLITCACGAMQPLRHDLHFSEPSSFQSGVSRGRRMASRGRLARVLHRLHSTSSQVANGRRRLHGPAIAFHADRSSLRLRAVGLPDGFPSGFAAVSARIFAPSRPRLPLATWSVTTATLAGTGNATRL
jgi:hypothetical protein